MVEIKLCGRNSTAHKNALFPTKKQIVLMIIGAVLLTVLLAAVILAPIIVMGNKKIVKDTATPSPVLTERMNYISDSAPICDIAIPGSHDSACYGMPYYAETQGLTIGEQLERGVRYFDIRVNNSKDGCVIFHGPVNGASYFDVLKDIDEFTDAHPSEFLILDMSHFKNGSEPMVFSLLEETLGDKILRLYRSEFSNKTVSEITLGEVRGKCLILTDASETDYYKNNPNINLRTNETDFYPEWHVLFSFYEKPYNAKSAKYFVEKVLPIYFDRAKQLEGGMFVLQAQLTDMAFVFGPRYREGQLIGYMNDFVRDLAESENLPYVNIIMRDFVDCEKCALTVRLNIAKGYVKTDLAEQFADGIYCHLDESVSRIG